jgi:hypothetical protein
MTDLRRLTIQRSPATTLVPRIVPSHLSLPKTDSKKFDFLGYTFQPRRAQNRWGKHFVSFLPAMSTKAAKAIRASIREWRMASPRKHQHLEDLARFVNPVVRGGMTITDGFIARNVF